MIANIIVFLATCVWNVIFFYLCGYWQQMALNMDWKIDLFFGAIAVMVLALGETSVIRQIYLRDKYRKHKKSVYDIKFIRQCVLLVLFHACTIYFISVIVYLPSIFYISILAIVLSIGWLRGSKVLWTSEETLYFLDEKGKLYTVKEIMENDEVVELACSKKGERDRTITIRKSRQYLKER